MKPTSPPGLRLPWSNEVVDPGEGPGGLGPAPNFSTKMRPEVLKKIFWRPAPPLISGSGWPPPLIWRSGIARVELVSTPVSDHPTCEDLVVAHENRQKGGLLASEKRSLHILFSEDNLLHAIAKLSSENSVYTLSSVINCTYIQLTETTSCVKCSLTVENNKTVSPKKSWHWRKPNHSLKE